MKKYKYVLTFDNFETKMHKEAYPFPLQKERVNETEEKELLPKLVEVFNLFAPVTEVYSLQVYKRFLFFFWKKVYCYWHEPNKLNK